MNPHSAQRGRVGSGLRQTGVENTHGQITVETRGGELLRAVGERRHLVPTGWAVCARRLIPGRCTWEQTRRTESSIGGPAVGC